MALSSSEGARDDPVFDFVCRCCLTDEVELKPIFNSNGSIPEAIFLFTAVKVGTEYN